MGALFQEIDNVSSSSYSAFFFLFIDPFLLLGKQKQTNTKKTSVTGSWKIILSSEYKNLSIFPKEKNNVVFFFFPNESTAAAKGDKNLCAGHWAGFWGDNDE